MPAVPVAALCHPYRYPPWWRRGYEAHCATLVSVSTGGRLRTSPAITLSSWSADVHTASWTAGPTGTTGKAGHVALLELLGRLPCQVMNQAGVVTGKVWFNFVPDTEHRARLASTNFTDHRRIRRTVENWGRRYQAVPAIGRLILAARGFRHIPEDLRAPRRDEPGDDCPGRGHAADRTVPGEGHTKDRRPPSINIAS